MEMKDKLKRLRSEKKLTQAQLADALHVSRSTVAKWENGLGLPNPDSMKMLESFYGIAKDDVATGDPEIVIGSKNRKIHVIMQVCGWLSLVCVLLLMSVLPFAILNGNYGFTAEMAAGIFADDPYIDTGDYRIYYHTFEGDWEDGRHWELLSAMKLVEKHFWGWTVPEREYPSRMITQNNYVVGRLTSIKGRNGYYNIIGKQVSNNMSTELLAVDMVRISGVNYDVQNGFFFITKEPVSCFFIGESFFDVE